MSDTPPQESIQDESSNLGEEQSVPELPGRRLREQRESNHLSREEVAHHLRLDVQLIKALEENDYSHLPSPAYICGYLRSYARLLKLPEDQIVQAYSHGEQIHAAMVPESVSILPKKMGVNFAFVKTIIIIIIAALVAGGLYLIAEKFDIFSGGSPAQKSSELAVPIAPETVPQPAQEDTAAPVPDTQAPESVSSAEQAPSTAKPETSATLIEQLPTPKTTIPNVAATDTDAQATPAAAPVVSTQAAQTVPSAPPQTLRLHFLDDSWIEVTDNTGKRLIYQLVVKNADLNLEGEAPFTILLGNAPAVQVFYKGKEFDHTRYHRGEIAYFRVGTK